MADEKKTPKEPEPLDTFHRDLYDEKGQPEPLEGPWAAVWRAWEKASRTVRS